MAHATISAGYSNLVGVVVDLLRQLEKDPLQLPNEVKAGARENGRSATVVVLCAAIIEGHVNRRYHFEEIDGRARREEPRSRKRLLSWLRAHLGGTGVEVDHIEEVSCARDMIIHGHTWRARTDGRPRLHFFEEPTLSGYGDNLFRKVLDEKTRKSKLLRLNLYPLRVWRRDAYECFRLVTAVLATLDKSDPINLRLDSNWGDYLYRRRHRTLPDIARKLPALDDC
jgi:hypothetical protein